MPMKRRGKSGIFSRKGKRLVGEPSLNNFLAAVEQTCTDFDFPHDGLSFSRVSRVCLVLFVGVPVKDVAAFTNWYSCLDFLKVPFNFFLHHSLAWSQNNRACYHLLSFKQD